MAFNVATQFGKFCNILYYLVKVKILTVLGSNRIAFEWEKLEVSTTKSKYYDETAMKVKMDMASLSSVSEEIVVQHPSHSYTPNNPLQNLSLQTSHKKLLIFSYIQASKHYKGMPSWVILNMFISANLIHSQLSLE